MPLSIPPVSFDDESLFSRSVGERRSLSFITLSPFPLSRGRGTKGDGVDKQNSEPGQLRLLQARVFFYHPKPLDGENYTTHSPD